MSGPDDFHGSVFDFLWNFKLTANHSLNDRAPCVGLAWRLDSKLVVCAGYEHFISPRANWQSPRLLG